MRARQKCQPELGKVRRTMHKRTARDNLAENIAKLAAAAGRSIHGWAVAKGLDPKKVQRATKNDTKIGDTLQAIADAARLEPWQLLHPQLNAGQIADLSPKAIEVAHALDAITDPVAFEKAYAVMIQAAELGNIPSSPSTPQPSAAPTPKPARVR